MLSEPETKSGMTKEEVLNVVRRHGTSYAVPRSLFLWASGKGETYSQQKKRLEREQKKAAKRGSPSNLSEFIERNEDDTE